MQARTKPETVGPNSPPSIPRQEGPVEARRRQDCEHPPAEGSAGSAIRKGVAENRLDGAVSDALAATDYRVPTRRRTGAIGVVARAAVVAVLAAGCAGRPGLGPEALRTPVDVGDAPWRSLGLVATEAGGRCTGALVAPQAVLTAAHCVFNPRTARPVEAGSVHFLLAIAPDGRAAGRARAVGVVMGKGFTVAPGMRPDPSAAPDADWAVLVLDAPLGDRERSLPLAAGYAKPGTALAFGGYQADRARQMVADLACAVLGYGRDTEGRIMMRHSCAATSGASGGPLLVRASSGEGWIVAGVGSMAQTGVNGGWAVPTAAITRAVLGAASATASAPPPVPKP